MESAALPAEVRGMCLLSAPWLPGRCCWKSVELELELELELAGGAAVVAAAAGRAGGWASLWALASAACFPRRADKDQMCDVANMAGKRGGM